ncbi:hypothetical protein E4U48_000818 [Claviceps purpurea]|nr:hypothetical protein E4U48_000818 [Claviceps purpurea]
MRARVAVPSGFRAAARTMPEPFSAVGFLRIASRFWYSDKRTGKLDAENSAVNCCAEGPSRGVAGPSEPRNPLHMAVSPRLKKGNLDQGDKVLSTATSRDTLPIGRRHAATAILALPPSFQRRRDQGFPVRLSENQKREDIRKNIKAANGSGIIRATAWKPKGTATRAPLILGVDSIDAANRLCAQAPSVMRRSSRQSRTTRKFAHGSAIAATNSGTSPHSAAPQLSAAAARPPNTRQSRSARRFTEWFGRSAPTVMVQTLSCGQHAVDAGQIGLSKPAAGIHQLPGK